MKRKLFLLIAAISAGLISFAQTARLQVIHNAADPAASAVDVYVNGNLFLDDFEFRKATAFQDVPAGVSLTVAIAPSNSSSVADSLISIPLGSLMMGETYVLIANGVVGSGFATNPDGRSITFGLYAVSGAREAAANAGEVDVLVFHGATDAPTVDVVARVSNNELNILDDLAYSDFSSSYLSVTPGSYILDVRDATGSVTVASFYADLSGLAGSSVVVFASGFLNPQNNNNGQPFGLWVALADGTTLPLSPIQSARLQAIHNSADAAAASVDIYVTDAANNELAKLEDVAFRTATAFLDLPSNIPLSFAFAPDNSSSISDAVATIPVGPLTTNEKYIAIANGILSSTGYSPSPAFNLHVFSGAREAAANQGANETDILIYHGSTDAPTVDVAETGVGAGSLVDDISYGEFRGYLTLSVNDYVVTIRDATGTTNVASFSAPLSTLNLADAALCVLASGFLNPANNSNGPAFGLYAALPSGGPLVALPVYNPTGLQSLPSSIHSLAAYPNPASNTLVIEFSIEESADLTARLLDAAGRDVKAPQSFTNGQGGYRIAVDMEDLPRGSYFIHISEPGKAAVVQQVILQ
ncbi:MAG: hypothetical protein KatS3mg031_1469 [Chitinophagales bacterium]|nr:MAG: hypothetical protein KatS3mg031_1469 [Chitinophagales bacterium]